MTDEKTYRLSADREKCFGSGQCVFWAPKIFDQDDDAIVKVLQEKITGGDIEDVKKAVSSCPTQCLSIEEI